MQGLKPLPFKPDIIFKKHVDGKEELICQTEKGVDYIIYYAKLFIPHAGPLFMNPLTAKRAKELIEEYGLTYLEIK